MKKSGILFSVMILLFCRTSVNAGNDGDMTSENQKIDFTVAQDGSDSGCSRFQKKENRDSD